MSDIQVILDNLEEIFLTNPEKIIQLDNMLLAQVAWFDYRYTKYHMEFRRFFMKKMEEKSKKPKIFLPY